MIKKNKRSLLVKASVKSDNLINITLTDAIEGQADNAWREDCIVSTKDYDESNFDNMDFDEKELADFGYFILSRIYAFKKQGEI
jgi:hypothetical protein